MNFKRSKLTFENLPGSFPDFTRKKSGKFRILRLKFRIFGFGIWQHWMKMSRKAK
jgi:hypothetical protein